MADNSALGKGLDALIKQGTKPKTNTKKRVKHTEDKIEKEVKTESNNNLTLSQEKIELIKEQVTKNPRISLWSAQSAAVLKYLKKTEPEFSISNEASKLLTEAISEKYPEIWEQFEDLNK